MAPSGLRPLPYRKVRRRLAELGFAPIRQSGSHVLFARADGRRTAVPRHDRGEVGRGLLLEILRQARLDPDEFLAGFA